MPKFYMTDDEIRRDYTKAKDRKRQLGILGARDETTSVEIVTEG